MMLPSQLGLVPLFILVNNLKLVNTLYALIVPALVTAFGVFWMRQIIDAQVPNELLEAASIDGASVPRILEYCHAEYSPKLLCFRAICLSSSME